MWQNRSHVVRSCDKTEVTWLGVVTKQKSCGYQQSDLIHTKSSIFISLSVRQAVGGLVAVWNDVLKTTWLFMKEISSDGDISTVRKLTTVKYTNHSSLSVSLLHSLRVSSPLALCLFPTLSVSLPHSLCVSSPLSLCFFPSLSVSLPYSLLLGWCHIPCISNICCD